MMGGGGDGNAGSHVLTLITVAWCIDSVESIKGECSVFLKKKYIMDENNSLSEYIKIPLGHNRTNGAVYSKINFKVEICSAL